MSIRKKILSDKFAVPEVLDVTHFSSLDGIRAISVFIVLIGHANSEFHNKLITAIFAGGTLGVYIFFVISGFLITSLLLKEKLKTGTISLRNFYIRRSLRILPVAYLYLIVLFILRTFFGVNVMPMEFVGCLLFVVNLGYFHTGVYTGHYWSLSVEEQFYIIFPSILKRNYRLYVNFLFVLLIIIITLKYVNFSALNKLYPKYHFLLGAINILNDFIYYFEGIIIGSLLSISMFKNIFPWQFVRKYKILLHILFIPIIIILCNNLFTYNNFNFAIASILIAVLLASNLEISKDWIFRFLNFKPLKTIGILSYSIYIWQQLVIFKFGNMFNSNKYIWESTLLCILILGLIVYVSHYFFEKRFLILKDRFTEVKF
jgi:peptidoglycan/LPS O-acetylase OafA/YrhL